jgi:BASS family bile acid:Na+ symporter
VASKKAEIAHAALPLFISVFLLNAFGFGAGYIFALASGCRESLRRTSSIEVGMQNSGLGVVLARQNFADPLTAVPCAISSVFHSVIGSMLAGWWRWRDSRR